MRTKSGCRHFPASSQSTLSQIKRYVEVRPGLSSGWVRAGFRARFRVGPPPPVRPSLSCFYVIGGSAQCESGRLRDGDHRGAHRGAEHAGQGEVGGVGGQRRERRGRRCRLQYMRVSSCALRRVGALAAETGGVGGAGGAGGIEPQWRVAHTLPVDERRQRATRACDRRRRMMVNDGGACTAPCSAKGHARRLITELNRTAASHPVQWHLLSIVAGGVGGGGHIV